MCVCVCVCVCILGVTVCVCDHYDSFQYSRFTYLLCDVKTRMRWEGGRGGTFPSMVSKQRMCCSLKKEFKNISCEKKCANFLLDFTVFVLAYLVIHFGKK